MDVILREPTIHQLMYVASSVVFQTISLTRKRSNALSDQRFEEFKGTRRPRAFPSALSATFPFPAGTLAKDVTTQFEDQGRLLKEANRDLAVFKNAYSKAEQEKQDLVQQLKVSLFSNSFSLRWPFRLARHNFT